MLACHFQSVLNCIGLEQMRILNMIPIKEVRKFFVNHEGKEPIKIEIGSIADLGASWLYEAFSENIRQRIKTPGYVDDMEANFSTTGPDQLVSSRVMIMSSLEKYFEYKVELLCGIPGVEMTGTLEDWEVMLQKFRDLENLLAPILEEIDLTAVSWNRVVRSKLFSSHGNRYSERLASRV